MEQIKPVEKPQQSDADIIKQILIDQYIKDHKALAITINRIPFPKEIKEKIILFLDTSYIWGEKALSLMDFNKQVSQPNQVAVGEPHPNLEVIEAPKEIQELFEKAVIEDPKPAA